MLGAPTLYTLRELATAGRDGVAALLAGTAERDIVTVPPRLVEFDGVLG